MKGYCSRIALILLMIALLIFAGCQSEPEAAEVAAPEVEEAAVVENTAVPPTEISDPGLITSAGDMVGIWLGTVAGETGYVMYTDDGRYTVALSQDNVGSAPRVSGEYWFEDGKIHLRDLENAGHWTVCDAETVGVYEVAVLEGGRIKFQTIDDGCNEGGFTRNYIFANMTQEWIAEPVAMTEADE